jgi:hypothetical protein
MLKIATTFCAVLIAVSAFSATAEARWAGGGARMGGFSGARMGGWSGARFASPGRMGFAGPGRMGIARAGWAGRGAWAGGRWAGGRWAGGRWGGWRGGRWWPWGVGAGFALAASWPYYGGYGYGGYGYDDCVQWRPDWGWVNVCGSYGGW